VQFNAKFTIFTRVNIKKILSASTFCVFYRFSSISYRFLIIFFFDMVYKTLILCLMLICSYSAGAQNKRAARQLEDARKAWQMRDLEKTESLALKALQSEKENIELILLLAEVYHELKQPENEIIYLEMAGQLPYAPALINFRLAESYFKTGQYEKALTSIEKYLSGSPSTSLISRAERIRANAEFAANAIKNPVGFSPENMGNAINTAYDEYWPSLTVDGSTLIFTRLLPVGASSPLGQEDFYLSYSDSLGWTEALPVEEINTQLNEGAQTISADGTLLFFTLCNHPDGFGSCDIWFSRQINGSWSAPRNAGRPLNTSAWEGQPSLSAFGDVLYFSGNRPGGKGNKDIWSIELKGWRPDGLPLWGEPVNLGDSINTPGEEISPFIHHNGRDLFFSSDYWPGFGGLDLFRSQRKLDGAWTKAQNLGYPINTLGNEQGLVIDRTGTTAYMASNRKPENGMDIFTFELDHTLRPDPVTYIRGKVLNQKTGEPVPAEIALTGLEKGISTEARLKADWQGWFTVTLPVGQEFAFHVNHPGYLFYSEYFMVEAAQENHHPIIRTIELLPLEIGSQTHLYNVFFDTGSFVLLSNSEPELDALVSFLKQNPSLKIEIQGHTDNIGSESYNQILSENRALAVVRYLERKEISTDRITSKGYGFSIPIDTNETEFGRSKNRRTTVEVTGVLPLLRQ
jgi:outer membrane protein OmpA-like peptidoglycan-associated protein/tetratricopeptide (TPR) repeat protein